MSTRSQDPDQFEEPPGFEDDDMFARRERAAGGDKSRGRPRVVSEFVRRAIENTVGSMQNTSHVSKEAISYLLQQGDKGRREVMRVIAKEVGDFLRQTDISSEVVKVLTNIQLEVNASVRFKPTADQKSVTPDLGGDLNVHVYDSDGRDLMETPPEEHAEPESTPSGDPEGAVDEGNQP